MQWHQQHSIVPGSLAELKQILLDNRNITDSEAFFHPVQPTQLTEKETGISATKLAKFARRVKAAIAQEKAIVVFGDYDADGICATGIMWEVLHQLGAKVRPFLPDRFLHGYGLNDKSLQAVLESGDKPAMMITVDNGIVALDAVAKARSLGIEVLLTDHHKPETTLPAADLVIHSTKLCGAGIAWVIANHLSLQSAAASLDLAAIATVADQVPLLGANRAIVWHGLQKLHTSQRVGLVALCQAAGINQAEITERTIGFGLAPRLNAMGRLGSPMEALRLMCTTDRVRAKSLATMINATNLERQELTADALALADQQAQAQQDKPFIVVKSDTFHEGVIGLIAGQLMEKYGKPVLVLALTDTFAKGSARSVSHINVVEVLRSCRSHLVEVGGHPMAAGCSVELDQIDQLQICLVGQINAAGTKEVSQEYETTLPVSLISPALEKLLASFAPFGMKNPQPIFKLDSPQILSSSTFGQGNVHRKYLLKSASKIEVIYWGQRQSPTSQPKLGVNQAADVTPPAEIFCKLIGLNRYGVMQMQGI